MSQMRKTVMNRNMKRTGLIKSNQQDFAPTKWSDYFDSEKKVETNDGTFHLYKKGSTGPILFCLHGGGYSGLTWALFAVDIISIIECQIIAIDLRGHGNTTTNNDTDLSLTALAKDVVEVIEKLFKDESQPIVFVGHSMGGAIGVEAAAVLKTIAGICVIDVVEGTALEALSSMQSFLRGRPTSFKTIQHAIQWCYKGGQTHNIEAAKVSMPGQIINVKTGSLAANELDSVEVDNTTSDLSTISKGESSAVPTIDELDEERSNLPDIDKPPLPKAPKTDYFPLNESPKYTWRIDLSKTEPYWSGWYSGLSQKFLDLRVPKMLFLANIHGLDRTLTVGQMQGKFQLQVLNKSGHAIQEDQPHSVADIIAGFLVKQKIATAKTDVVPPMPGC